VHGLRVWYMAAGKHRVTTREREPSRPASISPRSCL